MVQSIHGDRSVDDRRAGDRRRCPRDSLERLLDAALGEAPAEVAVIDAQHVDAEATRRRHLDPTLRRRHRQEPDQRRVERHRGERTDGEPDWFAVDHRRDHRDTGGEVAEHEAIFQGIDRHHGGLYLRAPRALTAVARCAGDRQGRLAQADAHGARHGRRSSDAQRAAVGQGRRARRVPPGRQRDGVRRLQAASPTPTRCSPGSPSRASGCCCLASSRRGSSLSTVTRRWSVSKFGVSEPTGPPVDLERDRSS